MTNTCMLTCTGSELKHRAISVMYIQLYALAMCICIAGHVYMYSYMHWPSVHV